MNRPSDITRRRLLASGASAFMVAAMFGDHVLAQDSTPEANEFFATPEGNFVAQTGIEREEMVIGVQGIPSNPEVQGMISYQVWADFQGVRFPHEFAGVPQDGTEIELTVHDVTGRRVADLPLSAGAASASWDGRDAAGRPTASGVYFLRLTDARGTASARVLRLR